eukprot:scaffold912_cov187-Ochromonas_danica.AAC.41
MVYFVCEGCNETLKKNQVDKHAYSCKSCHAVTCVDCQVSFYGDDYAAHVTCISEAEKYEKSLFKPKAGKPKAQDIWNELIEGVVAMNSKAPPQVQPYLERISNLTNVPRNQKKFLNFARNSLNIRSDGLLEMIWKFLDGCRVEREKELEKDTTSPPSSSGAKTEKVAEPGPASVVEEEKESKKAKKEKRKLEEVVAEVKPDATTVSEEVVENDEQKKKKKKKDKKEKEKVVMEEKVEEKKKEKKEKKEKKSKKDKA